MEVAAKMAQDASKSGFGEGLEASWRRLGAPKRGPRGTKIDVGRVFFLKLKKHLYNKWSWKQFLLVFGAPWRSKNLHFALERLQKSAFQEVAF